jgi:hypothetical protein
MRATSLPGMRLRRYAFYGKCDGCQLEKPITDEYHLTHKFCASCVLRLSAADALASSRRGIRSDMINSGVPLNGARERTKYYKGGTY